MMSRLVTVRVVKTPETLVTLINNIQPLCPFSRLHVKMKGCGCATCMKIKWQLTNFPLVCWPFIAKASIQLFTHSTRAHILIKELSYSLLSIKLSNNNSLLSQLDTNQLFTHSTRAPYPHKRTLLSPADHKISQ